MVTFLFESTTDLKASHSRGQTYFFLWVLFVLLDC